MSVTSRVAAIAPNSSIASQLIYTKGFQPFRSVQEAQFKTKVLYRRALRLIPWIIDTYQVDEHDKQHIAGVIRKNIEQHKDVKDLDTLSVLIFKGEHTFQEVAMLWKTRSHVLAYLQEERPDERNYLERFFANEPYTTEEEHDAALAELQQYAFAEATKRSTTIAKGTPYHAPFVLTKNFFGKNPALDKKKVARNDGVYV